MRNVSDKYCGGNQNTQLVFDNVFLISHRLRDTVEKYYTAGQDTDDNVAHEHSVSTNTHSEYVVIIDFRCNNGTSHTSMFRFTYIACLVKLFVTRFIMS
jgi:hypothetical protein